MRRLLLTICLAAFPALAADVYTFTVPEDAVTIGDPFGHFYSGWSYTLDNQSSSLWLVTTGMSYSFIDYADPNFIFQSSTLVPGAMLTIPYNPLAGTGLLEIAWDPDVPPGFVNSGVFSLYAQWWSGDPAHGGTLVSAAPVADQPYSVSLIPVPEPTTVGLVGLALLGTGLTRLVRPQRVLTREHRNVC
jgi:hypothetical protein